RAARGVPNSMRDVPLKREAGGGVQGPYLSLFRARQFLRPGPLAGVFGRGQSPDPDEGGPGVQGVPLEIGKQAVREIGERNSIEMLCLVRVFASLRPRPVEGGLQLTDSSLGICPHALLPYLCRLQAVSQLTDHLASRFCEGERLLAGSD